MSSINTLTRAQDGLQPLGVQDQGPVSQEIPESGEIFGKTSGKNEIITVQQDIKTRKIQNLCRECHYPG